MRTKIVAANWKMNNNREEAEDLILEILKLSGKRSSDIIKVIAPPFLWIQDAFEQLSERDDFSIAAQNCASEAAGAYTGEISAKMIKSAGADLVIIGHSERRTLFLETDEQLAKKVNLALENELIPIFCIGEKLNERESKKHFDVIKKQLNNGLFHLKPEDFKKVIIAYEPVWAIGTGVTATSAQAQEMHAYIRTFIAEKYTADIANRTSILYGGSCNAQNAAELFACKDVDGGLIGGASLKAADFIKITKSFPAK